MWIHLARFFFLLRNWIKLFWNQKCCSLNTLLGHPCFWLETNFFLFISYKKLPNELKFIFSWVLVSSCLVILEWNKLVGFCVTFCTICILTVISLLKCIGITFCINRRIANTWLFLKSVMYVLQFLLMQICGSKLHFKGSPTSQSVGDHIGCVII